MIRKSENYLNEKAPQSPPKTGMIKLGYISDRRFIYRSCDIRGSAHKTRLLRPQLPRKGASNAELWLASFLSGSPVENVLPTVGNCRIIDVFCGCGGFTLGIRAGLQAAGFQSEVLCAVDIERAALAVYKSNHQPKMTLLRNANSLVDFQVKGAGGTALFQYAPTVLERDLIRHVDGVDLFIAGPPCQGHSNLNNQTRRNDPKNLLYVTAASLGVALGAKIIVVENVPTVIQSHGDVVETAKALLRSSGYSLSEVLLDASVHGCAQTRKRHFLFAQKIKTPNSPLDETAKATKCERIPVASVIGDLLDVAPEGLMDGPSSLSEDNKKRIQYLFDHDLFELPDKIRPVCHQDGHTYPSVYGRLKWDQPAQTITSGFLSPGRGRFIHPTKPRGLTLHEGARIQGFPDNFRFEIPDEGTLARSAVAKMIADAVPPALGTVVGIAAASLLESTSERFPKTGPGPADYVMP